MSFVSPPTDNLYKFIAITGLLLFLFCLYTVHESNKSLVMEGKAERFALHYTYTKDSLTYLSLENRHNRKDSVRKSLIAANRSDSNSIQEIADLTNEIIKLESEMIDSVKHYQLKAIDGMAKSQATLVAEAYGRDEQKKEMSLYTVLGTLGGCIWIYGFLLWYRTTQRYQDHIIWKDALSKDWTPEAKNPAFSDKILTRALIFTIAVVVAVLLLIVIL
jgi:hypothetical protein